MAVLVACANGNFTTAATWALVDATSYVNNNGGRTGVGTGGPQASSTFIPGAITIDAIGIKPDARTAVSGTITVDLFNSTDTAVVAGTSVAVNETDIPLCSFGTDECGWFFFKFAPVTLIAGKSYSVRVATTVLTVELWQSGVGSNWCRALRTTTTQAPVAGDDLIITGEWTAAATVTARTVTMDQTAATDYGSAPTAANGLIAPGIAICSNGALTYGTTAATNYVLRLSNSLIVYSGGTLSIGTTGTPLPRDGSAVLEFDLAADGDYALIGRNGSTVNIQGLSRTSGKNVVSAKLTADSPTNLLQSTSNLPTALSAGTALTTLDPTGTSLALASTASGFNTLTTATDTVANSVHCFAWIGGVSVTNTTQVYTHWVKRGSGTNNRYVRLQLAVGGAFPATNGFYADFDLQTPSAGTCTALGNGTGTSASITAFGAGFICTIIGKISTSASAPTAILGACNASGVISYVGDATQNFITTWPRAYTLAAQPTQDTIDTDTGWLSGDVVALASTTRTAGECEVASLNGNAGASTLTYNLYPVNARSGTSPTQAEVILLTRNVKVRSTSSSLMSYVQIKSGAVVDIDWAEFYYIGSSNGAGFRGIDVEVNSTGATNFSMQFSSIHDTEIAGFSTQVSNPAATVTSLVFSSNTMWNLSTIIGAGANINGAITATNWSFDSNVLIRTGAGGGWALSDVGGTFTNNTVVGSASAGISLTEGATIGTMSGNIVHSTAQIGVSYNAAGIGGTFSSCTAWRNSNSGLSIGGAICADLVLDTPTCFGNTPDNISTNQSGGIWIKSPTLNGDTAFATTNGITLGVRGGLSVLVDNGNLSTVSGIKTAHTTDLNVSTSGFNGPVVLRNTILGSATEINTPSNLSNSGFVASEKHDQTAGNHMTWMRNGKVQTDSTTFNTAAPSMLMTPTSATLKLESAPQFQGMKVAVANGSTVTIAVYIRKSATYNGNQPRLIQKANPAIGVSADVVIATFSAGLSTWAQISGTTAAATDDGVVEFVVDCDGTVGSINQDDWSVS